MFKSAVLKLTVLYIALVMAISVIFSIVIYQISIRELNEGIVRQNRSLMRMGIFDRGQGVWRDFELTGQSSFDESRRRLKFNLFYFNLMILVLSGGASYLLARRTLRPIEEMVEDQKRFTADASHELRTPLTALKTEIEVALREKQIDEKSVRELLQSNLNEISKLEYLSNNLLKLARTEVANRTEFKAISLNRVIHNAYRQVEPLARKKNIDSQFDLGDLKIKGEESRLEELFKILFDNAIKYSPANSQVSVCARKKDRQVEVVVRDQGIGIKQSDLPFIFRRFYRADQSRSKDKADGYGLGLSIAKNIVDEHRGKIAVESKINQGTTFIVALIAA